MVFTTLAFISLIVFTANISFHKKRLDFRELMPSWAIMMLKLLYPLMLGINAWVLWNVSSPLLADWAGLLGTCLGGGIVWKARRDLGAAHTWVGYCRDQDEFVQSGIYRHIRHPLYTGIGVYIFSAGTTIALHGHWLSAGTYFLLSTLTLIFLALSAKKEEKALNNRIGEEYRKYIGEVGALFPKLALMQTLKTYVTRFCKKQSGAAKRYIIFLSVLQCCLTVHAGGVNRVSGLGPRGGAMSGSYTAIADGMLTGMISGVDPWGSGKVAIAAAICQIHSVSPMSCYAYADHWSDLPLLQFVGHPMAINPDRNFKNTAARAGIPVAIWSLEKTF